MTLYYSIYHVVNAPDGGMITQNRFSLYSVEKSIARQRLVKQFFTSTNPHTQARAEKLLGVIFNNDLVKICFCVRQQIRTNALLGGGVLFGPSSTFTYVQAKEETGLGLHSRVEVGSYTSIVALRVIWGNEKGSVKSETVKYDHESHGNQTKEWMHWRGPGAIVNDRPNLSPDRMLYKDYDHRCSIEKNILATSLKGLGAKMNWVAIYRQS
jgi:hypothetical protein